MKNELQLIVTQGFEVGKVYAVSENGALLGRSKVCEIALQDTQLSRQHCRIYFENKPMVQDLCSSNGTYLNGNAVLNVSQPLHNNDVLAIGEHVFRVVISEEPLAQSPETTGHTLAPKPIFDPIVAAQNVPPSGQVPSSKATQVPSDEASQEGSINLFNTEAEQDGGAHGNAGKDSIGKHFLWWVVCLIMLLAGGGAIYFMSVDTSSSKQKETRQLPQVERQAEFIYERLAINAQHLFRYCLAYDFTSNELSLDVVDLGKADRSSTKRMKLSEQARATLVKFLMEARLSSIGEIFPERSHDGVTLERRSLTIVRGKEVWKRVAENVQHLDFNELCDHLEFFARDELNVWAERYSVEELEAIAREQLEVADRYWAQRDLSDEMVWEALVAYKKGLSALDSLNPKPNTLAPLTKGFKLAQDLLDERYKDASFYVDQALLTQNYEQASEQLNKILRMIPDRDDARNRQATARLLQVEQRRKAGR